MSLAIPNRLKEDEDFWKDVLEKPRKKPPAKANLLAPMNELNSSRQAKFEMFINKYKEKNPNRNIIRIKQAQMREHVDKMLTKEKKRNEARRRNQEEHKQNKENEQIEKCTFRPHISHYTIKGSKDLASPHKIRNTDFYEKSFKWFKNLKGKRAQKKQQIEYSEIEYSFRPEINECPLESVFNKTQLEEVLPQNVYFLNTKESNKRKRLSASTFTLTNTTPCRKNKTFTSRSRSFHCSIEVLKNELRSTHNMRQGEEEED